MKERLGRAVTGESRRSFLRKSLLGTAALGTGGAAKAAGDAAAETTQVDRRVLGRTKASVSMLGLGLGTVFKKSYEADKDVAMGLLDRAVEHGVNYWDIARNYGTEHMVGPAVERHRKNIFLVSKSATRTYDGFLKDLETSLKELRTDHLDVYHVHNLSPKTDPDLDVVEKGAVRAARRAKEEGMIRNYGITGHSGPDILMHGIRNWDPDVLLTTFPCNRPEDGRYEDELLPLAVENGTGVVAMKTVRHAREADLRGSDLIRYALSLSGITTAIVGLDTQAHLDENADMASAFTPLKKDARSALSSEAQVALAGTVAPWDRPGYQDA